MEIKKVSPIAISILLFLFSVGYAGPVVRDAVKLDMSVPVGKIEGNQFTGIRYSINAVAPPNWQVTTEYSRFMLDSGLRKGRVGRIADLCF